MAKFPRKYCHRSSGLRFSSTFPLEKTIMQNGSGVVLLVLWFGGIAVSQGFWWKLLSTCLPPFGVYVFLERVLEMLGVVV